jgi:hypothetical protein
VTVLVASVLCGMNERQNRVIRDLMMEAIQVSVIDLGADVRSASMLLLLPPMRW